MFLEVKGVLQEAEIARLSEIAARLHFVDGRVSNPNNKAKNNLQADFSDPLHAESSNLLLAAIYRSRGFLDFAMPRRMMAPMLARYEPGMQYGIHSDSAYMPFPGSTEPLRSDVSATIFLSPPQAYEGGELAIHFGTRAIAIKGEPGDAIIYPSTTLHEVRPVRSGQRLVAITFVESLIADETKRNLLYELNEVTALEGLNMRWENRTRLEAVRNNLTRLWSA